jgi:predicted ArsR family transcriptional regulator
VTGIRPTPREKEIDTLDQLEVISSPFRIQLLESFSEPTTVKTVAEALDVPVTRIYYHVNKMVSAGFLEVVEERSVGSLTERTYAVTADSFRPSPAFIDTYGAEGRVEAAKLMFRVAEAGAEAAAAHGLFDDTDSRSLLGLSYIGLRPERRAEFFERLRSLLEEYDDRDGEPYWQLMAVLPRWRGSGD